MPRAVISLSAAALVMVACPAAVLADGDPASDVLITDDILVPYERPSENQVQEGHGDPLIIVMPAGFGTKSVPPEVDGDGRGGDHRPAVARRRARVRAHALGPRAGGRRGDRSGSRREHVARVRGPAHVV